MRPREIQRNKGTVPVVFRTMHCARIPENRKHQVVQRSYAADCFPCCARDGLSCCQINRDIQGESQEKDTDEEEMYFMLSEKLSRIHCPTLLSHRQTTINKSRNRVGQAFLPVSFFSRQPLRPLSALYSKMCWSDEGHYPDTEVERSIISAATAMAS